MKTNLVMGPLKNNIVAISNIIQISKDEMIADFTKECLTSCRVRDGRHPFVNANNRHI